MSWKGTSKFALGIFTVLAKAPADSGLYALFTRDKWIYIGEAENIQVHLLQHLNSPGPLVLRYGVTSFAYECVLPEARAARQQELIAEFSPLYGGCPTSPVSTALTRK
jgi:hypothetical protein